MDIIQIVIIIIIIIKNLNQQILVFLISYQQKLIDLLAFILKNIYFF